MVWVEGMRIHEALKQQGAVNRHFHEYEPPRLLEAIEHDIIAMLKQVPA
jgi:hypothetical protein